YPALLFENVKGFDMPVLTNTLGARSRLGAMLETTAEGALAEYMKRESNLIPPKVVPSGPIKDNILTGDEVDLRNFPIVWHAEKDGGPYITPPLFMMKNPLTGVQNVGMYRIQPKGPRKIGVSLGTHSHAYHIMKQNEKTGKDTEVAFALGHHPAVVAGTQCR